MKKELSQRASIGAALLVYIHHQYQLSCCNYAGIERLNAAHLRSYLGVNGYVNMQPEMEYGRHKYGAFRRLNAV